MHESDDWDMYLEWIKVVSLRLSCDGHHLANGNLVGQKSDQSPNFHG